MWHNDVATAIGTILLVNSHYFCLNVYARGAVGESIAMCFMPLFFYGLYNLVSENYSHPIFLIIGILGSGLSHTITTAFCLLAGIIVCLFNLKKILTKDITRKEKRKKSPGKPGDFFRLAGLNCCGWFA